MTLEIKTTIDIYTQNTNNTFKEDIAWTNKLQDNKQWVSVESLLHFINKKYKSDFKIDYYSKNSDLKIDLLKYLKVKNDM